MVSRFPFLLPSQDLGINTQSQALFPPSYWRCYRQNCKGSPPPAVVVLLVAFGTPGTLIGLSSGLLNQQVRHVSLLFPASCYKFFIRLHWVGSLLYFPSDCSSKLLLNVPPSSIGTQIFGDFWTLAASCWKGTLLRFGFLHLLAVGQGE